MRVGRREVPFTHPDKLLFSDPPVSKRDLAVYYDRVAEPMLALIRDRPLSLQAYPDGIAASGYYMKSIPSYFPDWIARSTVAKRGGQLTQVLATERATLVYLAGQNVVTPHAWLSRADAPRRPDRLIIDLDPNPGVGFSEIRAAARAVGERLRDAGLATFAMVTGSRGVHVLCPLRREPEVGFPEVHRFAHSVAASLVADAPEHLTLEWRREDRGRRIFLDVNRINYAQTAVAPFAVRPAPGAPVAMPIHWEELEDRSLDPRGWTIATAPDRLADAGNPWAGLARHARRLPRPADRSSGAS